MEDLNKQYIVQGDSSTSYLQVSNCFGDILIDVLYCSKTKHSFLERVKIALKYVIEGGNISRASFYLNKKDTEAIKEVLKND